MHLRATLQGYFVVLKLKYLHTALYVVNTSARSWNKIPKYTYPCELGKSL